MQRIWLKKGEKTCLQEERGLRGQEAYDKGFCFYKLYKFVSFGQYLYGEGRYYFWLKLSRFIKDYKN